MIAIRFLAGVLLAALGLTIILRHQCQCLRFSIYDDYMDLPKQKDFQLAQHQIIRDALFKLINLVGDNKEPEAYMEKIVELSNTEPDNGLAEAYKILAPLRDHDSKCPPELLGMLKSMVAQMRAQAPEGQLHRLEPFLERYAADRLMRRVFWDQPEHRGLHHSIGSLIELFDHIFKRGLHKRVKAMREKFNLLDELEQLDLATAELDVHRMIRAAVERTNTLDFLIRPVKSLVRLLERKCRTLAHYGSLFDAMNLATALGKYQSPMQTIRRVNEYHRLCLALGRPETRSKIQQHLEESAASSSNCTKLATCLFPFAN